MATMVMLVHHAFRRDLARLAASLDGAGPARPDVLRDAWQKFGAALHGHHDKEDSDIFPSIARSHPALEATIAELSAQHGKIAPLLERGGTAFGGLPGAVREAKQVIADLSALLDTHLDLEEASVIPVLRDAREFPAPANDEELALYAAGFAWSLDGIAPDVVERVTQMMPGPLKDRLPAARQAFEADRDRTWGAAVRRSASRTSVPAYES
jgi:hypothetical protein